MCVRACRGGDRCGVCACVRVCMRVCMCMRVCVCVRERWESANMLVRRGMFLSVSACVHTSADTCVCVCVRLEPILFGMQACVRESGLSYSNSMSGDVDGAVGLGAMNILNACPFLHSQPTCVAVYVHVRYACEVCM
jgi:hypothetical protein